MNTFSKLKTGNWGIRATAKVAEGDRVPVTKKDGTIKIETVAKVVWTDNATVWLCAIGAPEAKPASQPRARRFVPCGYPGCHPNHCDECDGEGGYSSGW